jgi:hypothetical protein
VREIAIVGLRPAKNTISSGGPILLPCGSPAVAIVRDQAAAIQEINIEVGTAIEYENGERKRVPVRKVRFKLADNRAALRYG